MDPLFADVPPFSPFVVIPIVLLFQARWRKAMRLKGW